MGVVIMPMSATTGETGGGTCEDKERGSSQSIGSVFCSVCYSKIFEAPTRNDRDVYYISSVQPNVPTN